MQSVAFSGPGLLYSKDQQTTEINGETKGPNLESAIKLSTNFIPTRDPVPRVDDHMGSVVDIACSDSGWGLSCHGLGVHICELLLRCGDDHAQERFHSCKSDHKILTDKLRLRDLLS